jgi:hypothetical protein
MNPERNKENENRICRALMSENRNVNLPQGIASVGRGIMMIVRSLYCRNGAAVKDAKPGI